MRSKKNRKPFATKIEATYVDTLFKLSDETGITQVRLLEEALKDLFRKYDIKMEVKED